jgi:hypothetical protein
MEVLREHGQPVPKASTEVGKVTVKISIQLLINTFIFLGSSN